MGGGGSGIGTPPLLPPLNYNPSNSTDGDPPGIWSTLREMSWYKNTIGKLPSGPQVAIFIFMYTNFIAFYNGITGQFKDVRNELKEVRKEMRDEFKEVRKEIKELTNMLDDKKLDKKDVVLVLRTVVTVLVTWKLLSYPASDTATTSGDHRRSSL